MSSADTSRIIGRIRSACCSSCASTGFQPIVLVLHQPVARRHIVADILLEPLRVVEIADPDAAPRDLVFVCRPDPARGRPDLALAAARFREQVEVAMVRQDQMGLVADQDSIADVDAVLRQLVDLGEQRLRIDDDAVADDAGHAGMQNARRNQPEHELHAVDVDGVAGVVSALIPGHDVEAGVMQVDDFCPLPSSPHCAPSTARFIRAYDSTRRKRAAAREIDARMKFDASRLRISRRRAGVKKKIFFFSIDNAGHCFLRSILSRALPRGENFSPC